MVTASAQQPRPVPPADLQQQQHLTVGQIVAILAAGLAAKKTLELLTKTLLPFGIAADAVRVAFHAATRRGPAGTSLRRPAIPGSPGSRFEQASALRSTLAGETVYRAAYLYAAAQRADRILRDAARNGQTRAEALRIAEAREQRFYAQHRQAAARRRVVAAKVDLAAARHGKPTVDPVTGTLTKLVGWHAVLDNRTDPQCRAADGKNFPVNRPPAIGWPGAVHPHCRCRPGAPHAGGRMVDTPARRAA